MHLCILGGPFFFLKKPKEVSVSHYLSFVRFIYFLLESIIQEEAMCKYILNCSVPVSLGSQEWKGASFKKITGI